MCIWPMEVAEIDLVLADGKTTKGLAGWSRSRIIVAHMTRELDDRMLVA